MTREALIWRRVHLRRTTMSATNPKKRFSMLLDLGDYALGLPGEDRSAAAERFIELALEESRRMLSGV